MRPTQPKKILTQNLAEGKSNLNKRPLSGTPPRPPPLWYWFLINLAPSAPGRDHELTRCVGVCKCVRWNRHCAGLGLGLWWFAWLPVQGRAGQPATRATDA